MIALVSEPRLRRRTESKELLKLASRRSVSLAFRLLLGGKGQAQVPSMALGVLGAKRLRSRHLRFRVRGGEDSRQGPSQPVKTQIL